jgi:hypothetical protein
MGRRPAIPKKQDQLALMFDWIAQVGSQKSTIGECSCGGRQTGFPIDIAEKLANLLRGSRYIDKGACDKGACRRRIFRRKGWI